MDPYEPPPEPTVDVSTIPKRHEKLSDEPIPLIVSALVAGISAVISGYSAAISGYYGFSLGVPAGTDGVWQIVLPYVMFVIGIAWGTLSLIVLFTYSRRSSIGSSAAMLFASAIVGGLFWFLVGYAVAANA